MSEIRQDAPKGNKRQQKATGAQSPKTRVPRRMNGVRNPNASITAPEALQLLASALAYCQQAGLHVNALNREDETLALFIPHARFVLTADGGAAFRLRERAAME